VRYLLHTYGCQMNVRDSEAVAACLEQAGHLPAINEADADLIIVNTCSVRGKAEEKALGKLGLLCAGKRETPLRRVGVMGCMAQRRGDSLFKKVPGLDFVVGTRRQAEIPGLIARLDSGERDIVLLDDSSAHPEVPSGHLAPQVASAFVSILLGCNRRCAYCVVPDVRGPEYSRPAQDILVEIQTLVASGVREITLLGQSVMNYGRSNPVWAGVQEASSPYREDFPRLLAAISTIPGLRRLRFTSGHPSGCTEELAAAMRDLPMICPHIHLPVQSGSDRILALMRRGYTANQYLEAIACLRTAVPHLAVTTDVIVGFPTETDEDFELTRSFMDKAIFDNAFIFKYSPRPNTPAAAMRDDVPAGEKQRRNQALLVDQDVRSQRLNDACIGQTIAVLVEGRSLRNARRWAGRSLSNKIVVFDPHPGLAVGDEIKVRITQTAPQTLYGEQTDALDQSVSQETHTEKV